MQIRILGPLDVVIDGNPTTPADTDDARLLALLASRINESVATEQIVKALWPTIPSQRSRARLTGRVRRLRQLLGSPGKPQSAQRWLLTERPGYALRVSNDELDAADFMDRRETGLVALRAYEYDKAADHLGAALALWRGLPFGELAHEPFLREAVEKLNEARLSALEARVDADLALGRHAEICLELENIVEANPMREGLSRRLMLALYRSDRQADALRAGARFRQLVAEVGNAVASAELLELEQDILLQKPRLDRVPTAPPDAVALSPAAFADLTGDRPTSQEQELDVIAPTRALIGRRAERQWLVDRLEEAQHGNPQVVLLRGEAGVGKSRLARDLVEEAESRGVTTSIGRFREQDAMPYDAFARDFFERLADAARDSQGPGGEAEVVRNLATFGSAGVDVESTEAQRIAAVHEGFLRLIRRGAFMLLVDDLQWADPASCDLLVNLVRLTADTSVHEPVSLLAVFVIRDEPGVPELPQLDVIRRENITTSLTLHGLSELDVSRLANAIGAHDLPRGVVDDITRVTRGNPLFVVALVKQFAAKQSQWPADLPVGGRLPSEIQGLIGSRVAALSSSCQEMLAVAAVLGKGWGLAELEGVTGVERASLGELLDEAEAAEVLVAGDGGYDFAHPLYERAALATIGSRRRQDTHRRIADTLISQRDPSWVLSMSIAQHLVDAGELADPDLLVEYCPDAGESAFAGFAWGDAARYFEVAFRAAERARGRQDALRVRLGVRASSARIQNGEPAAALRDADAAVAALGDDSTQEEVATAWGARLRAQLFTSGPGDPVDIGPLEALASELEIAEPRVAARVYSSLGTYHANATRDVENARTACRRAIDLGERYDEHGACAEGWGQLAVTQWVRLELADAVESLRAELAHARESGDRRLLSHALALLPVTLVWLGRFDEAEAAILEARTTTREISSSVHDGFVLVAEALIAAARGMYIESDAAVEDAIEVARMTGDEWPTALITQLLAWTRSLRGDDEGTEAVLEQWAPSGAPPGRAAVAWLLRQKRAVAAGHPPARDDLEGMWTSFSSFPTVSVDTVAALLIELSADIGAENLATEASRFLAVLAGQGQVFTTTMGLFIPRLLGVAAAASGDHDRARERLQESIAVATRLRAHAELAACQYELASVLAEAPDAREAASLLEQAHRAAGALGLAPLATRCVTLAERLGVRLGTVSSLELARPQRPHGVAATEMAVVVFTDISDSVALTEELGDWVFHDRARALQVALRRTIRDFAGSPVEGIKLGDGILAEFRSAESAVSCAVACSAAANDMGLPIHIGAHAGDVIRHDGDIFGGTVNIAARICSHAPTGEILVSQTIRDLARTSTDLNFTSLGPHSLKGIAEPVPLFAVHGSG
jgi:class 3 adenylate cyclase/DNA-binding SARP family transcriptional activator